MKNLVEGYKKSLSRVISQLSVDEVINVAQILLQARNSGNVIYTMGNGGSGSTASHMVCDILKGCSFGRPRRFKIFCLNDNLPTLLAYSNDISYEYVFEEQLKNVLNHGDVVIAISGSGNSKNIIRAANYAIKTGAIVIGFTGYDGGMLKQISTYSINANVSDMQMSEDLHLIVLHILYKILENE
jgi:D-sedoheptulose 7-phosphate isomerase